MSETGPPTRSGEVVRVRVRSLASSGAGVADLPDGRVGFVHRSLPGDTVDVKVRRVKKRWAEASLLRVVEPAPDRVDAPCPRFPECGGCTLQHVAYDEQRAWKGRFVADAMARIGGLEVEPPVVEPSPLRFGYRNRMTFTLRRLRSGRVVAGLHAQSDPDRILDIGTECLLPEAPVPEVWGRLRAGWGAGAGRLPSGRELRLTLRTVEDGVLLLVRGGAPGWDPAELVANVPEIRSLWHHPAGRARPALLHGERMDERWGEERVPVGGRAFLQVNRSAAEKMVAHVLAQRGEGRTAVDAYCGVGVYGRALARDGWRVVGIERDADACAGARHEAPEGFHVVEGAVEDRIGGRLPADLVILNPPRTGLHASVPEALSAARPGRVVYASCDPATLARDAARLGSAYRLASLHSFDLFPQTAHVESVAVFLATEA